MKLRVEGHVQKTLVSRQLTHGGEEGRCRRKKNGSVHAQYTTWTPVVHNPRNDKVERHTHTPNGIGEEAVSADGAGSGSATYGAVLTTQKQGVPLTSSYSYRRSRPSLMSNTSSEVSGSTAATCNRATKKEGTHDDVVGSTMLMMQASAHSRVETAPIQHHGHLVSQPLSACGPETSGCAVCAKTNA